MFAFWSGVKSVACVITKVGAEPSTFVAQVGVAQRCERFVAHVQRTPGQALPTRNREVPGEVEAPPRAPRSLEPAEDPLHLRAPRLEVRVAARNAVAVAAERPLRRERVAVP